MAVEPLDQLKHLDPHASRAGWQALLRLEFAAAGERTILARRSSVGPLVVQRAFYPEGGVPHVYIVHPPGGVVGGDRLEMQVHAQAGSHALITTPAATKFYRSGGRIGQQIQDLTVDAGAALEWLPQETILFPDAHAHVGTRVRLAEGAKFIGWELVCYGRQASGLSFGQGRARQDFELWLNEMPLVLDHLRLEGASDVMGAPFGLGGNTVLGTLFAYPASQEMLEVVRAIVQGRYVVGSAVGAAGDGMPPANVAVERPGGVIAACTRVDGVLVVRALGMQADAVRKLFTEIWQHVRPAITGRQAVLPRIWAT